MNTLITEHCGIDWSLDYTTDHHCADLVAVRPHDNEDDFLPFLRPDLIAVFQSMVEHDALNREIRAAEAEHDRMIDIALDNRERAACCHDRF